MKITDIFETRHIGPTAADQKEMLKALGFASLEELSAATVPKSIRYNQDLLPLGEGLSEFEVLNQLRNFAEKNHVFKNYLGTGYYGTITPPVIQRNILENPGWYTQYTPYQAEISQGRLEAMLNFQTMVMDLTGFEIANASLLDEATAAAEAMSLTLAIKGAKTEHKRIFVSENCHPQTIAVVKARAQALGIEVLVGDHGSFDFKNPVFAVLVQYPGTDGRVHDYRDFFSKSKASGALNIVAADPLALALLASPAELGADVAVGSTQRFGVPMGFGGPHAAYMATRDEYKRLMPGRIVGVTQDAQGGRAIRLALQTREQHIRRDKATSNICTAQVLLAVMASMYAVYHGPEGLKRIAQRVHQMAANLSESLRAAGMDVDSQAFFDTVKIKTNRASELLRKAAQNKINLRLLNSTTLTISVDETTTDQDLRQLLKIFDGDTLKTTSEKLPSNLVRKTPFLQHPVFNLYHSETELLRYIKRLENKDLSLTHSMIPLGSCTMKLNAAAEMLSITHPGFSNIHPFAPVDQTQGYLEMIKDLEKKLEIITGFSGISLQPNAGSQGEYAGLLVIRKFHETKGQSQRNICLIPSSAHGTNPASAVMAGMKVVVVKCDEKGNIDLEDLKAKATEHSQQLSCLMITYPSTHGVFEDAVKEICSVIHKNGGLVYMDGANMNAQVGLCRPVDIGADVCHLNLHKTFSIPHGGGGPGMGPIGVVNHLVDFLPSHPVVPTGGKQGIGAISAAPYGSASILPISWSYIAMMGALGLKHATQVAILNANYMAKRLDPHFPVLYKGSEGLVAHECIVDLRPAKAASGIEVTDVAKRLMDYGFHAPTVSFPVIGTLMIEPTESESKKELDRFCDAMIHIKKEIDDVAQGKTDRENNVLKNAPHTSKAVISDQWNRPYSREQAAFPAPWTREAKFWPSVSRVNDVFGDRNLVCSCPPIDDYA